MKAKLLIVIVSTCMGILAASDSRPSCPYLKFTIRGIVADRAQNPVKGASVYVFLGENENVSLLAEAKDGKVGRLAGSPDVVTTNGKGEFEAVSFYRGYDDKKKTLEPCAEKPPQMTVFIVKDGFLAKRKVYKGTEVAPVNQVIELRAISIDQDTVLK